jgi:metal-responsive CopG/Arc/MetJ family transcriptional regulator
MKISITLPNVVFQEAERLALLQNISRSQLYTKAIREYMMRHAPWAVTEALNRVCDHVGEGETIFATEAARKTLYHATR